MSDSKKLPPKWAVETKAVKATQVAFDVGEKVQYVIRKEALDCNVNPPDRIRQILGLKVSRKPKRLRLSISLTPDDMKFLAEKFEMDPENNIEIKHKAAELLIQHAKNNNEYSNKD
jgi:hypothetical protein